MELVAIDEIRVVDRVRKDLGDLEALAASIADVGLLQPIVLTPERRLVAGHRRLEAWKIMHKDADSIPPVPCVFVENLAEALPLMKGERDENTCRKNFTPSEAVAIGEKIRPEIEELAKAREMAGPSYAKLAEDLGKTGETRDEISESVGLGRTSYQRAKEIVESGDEELIQLMDDKGVNRAWTTKKKKEKIQHLEEVATKAADSPDGAFDVIVIDPPWGMQKIEREVAPNQTAFDYPTMSQEELLHLEIPAADNCHVWLWTTQKFLPDALELLWAWKLKYVCTFVWHKPGGFQPFNLPQYNCEFAIYATKGSPVFVETKAFFTCFNAPRGKHSEKPEEFYDVVRRVTAGRRLDMFNRRKIEGFVGWGKEAAK